MSERFLRRGLVTSALLAIPFAAGCGGDAQTCIENPSALRRAERLSVPEALWTKAGVPVEVRGALLVRRGEPIRLCTRLIETQPFPTCQEPALTVEGLGDPYRAVEGLERSEGRTTTQAEPAAGWASSVTITGLVTDATLHVARSCASEQVLARFEEQTGQELALDLFPGTVEREHLNFEALRDRAAARARREEWGRFSIVVWPGKPADAIAEERTQLSPYLLRDTSEPDQRGIVWLLLEDVGWLAVTNHGGGVLLEWTAGNTKRVDRRWKRLYALLEDLEQA
jgi:hypothetical protein